MAGSRAGRGSRLRADERCLMRRPSACLRCVSMDLAVRYVEEQWQVSELIVSI